MLPLSIGRTASNRLTRHPGWKRPANMASANPLERRAFSSWTAALVGMGVLIALGHVWLRLKVSETGYQIEATRQAIERLRQEAGELTAQAAVLDGKAHLEMLSQARLGLVRPQKGQEAILP
jgi:alkylhydroperoxidase/carboxymuconolactone decarboxylase family protein YurZ